MFLSCTSCTHVATSSPSFVNILCLVSFCLLHRLGSSTPLPLQYQSSPVSRPRTFHFRKHPLICTEVARRVEIDGMIQTDLLHSSVSQPVNKLTFRLTIMPTSGRLCSTLLISFMFLSATMTSSSIPCILLSVSSSMSRSFSSTELSIVDLPSLSDVENLHSRCTRDTVPIK